MRYLAAACQTDHPSPRERGGIAANVARMIATIERTVAGYEPFGDVRLLVFPGPPTTGRREYRFEGGELVPRAAPIQADEWGVHLPFAIGSDGARGELAAFRRYGRRPLLTDVNLVVDILYGYLDPRTRDART